jgi:hypothetical protein
VCSGLFNAPKMGGSYFIENTHIWVISGMLYGLIRFTVRLPEAKAPVTLS